MSEERQRYAYDEVLEQPLPSDYLEQLGRAWKAAKPGVGNPNHEAAWERWAALAHRAFPALAASADARSPRLAAPNKPEWKGPRPLELLPWQRAILRSLGKRLVILMPRRPR